MASVPIAIERWPKATAPLVSLSSVLSPPMAMAPPLPANAPCPIAIVLDV